MTIDLAAEAVVAVLLAVTISYCFVLNRRLSALRNEQEALADLITGLNQATARAQEGIFQLRSVSQGAEETLKREVAKAQALSDELALITEAGNNLAEKIEGGLTAALERDRAPRKVNPFPVEETRGPVQGNVRGNDDIRQALRAAR